MKPSDCVSIMMIAILLLAPLAALGAQETQPGFSADVRPSKAFRTGRILVGTGVVLGILGGVLLVEGLTTDNPATADHSKMFGRGALVAGGLSAGVGIFLIKVPLR